MSNLSLSPRIIIEDLKAIWRYRALILNFAINDLKARYRNTYLGYLWSLIEPVAWFGVIYIIFTIAFPIRTENYALYLFLGIIMYHGFTRGTMQGMHGIISKSGIVSRVALPLEATVLGTVLSSFISLLLDVGVFLALMIAVQFLPPATILFLPLLLGLELILILAVSLPLSVLSVFHRDLEHAWRVFTALGFWITPIAYRFEIFPTDMQAILLHNPIAGVIELGHAFVVGTPMMNDYFLFYTIAIPFVILFWGYAIFKHYVSRVVEEI